MSMHKTPLSKMEEEGLLKHGLPVGVPSQLSDTFRQGIAWALQDPYIKSLIEDDQQAGITQALRWTPYIRGESEPTPGVEVLVRYARQWPNDKVFFVTGAALHKYFDEKDDLYWFNGRGESMGGTVSHWMPMPSPDSPQFSPNPADEVKIHENTDQEREAFEAWFAEYSLSVRMNGGSMNYAQMFAAWQARTQQPVSGERFPVKRYERDQVAGHSDVEVAVPGLIHYDHGPNLAEALARLAYRVAKFHKLDAPTLCAPHPVSGENVDGDKNHE